MKISNPFIAITALLAFASCSGSDFLGDKEALTAAREVPISLASGTPAITRADKTGADAAAALNKNFVIFGYKTMSDASTQTVFPNYQVNYVANTAHTTTTNSANWEYVGYKNVPDNMTDNNGIDKTGIVGITASGVEQSVKYWDFSASKYKFYGYSLGVGNSGTYARASLMGTTDTYTLQGTKDQLLPCYISEITTINDPKGSTSKEVELRFLSFLSKIRMGFYETIPGYSVKNLKFYINNTTKSSSDDEHIEDGLKASLYDADTRIPDGGKYVITFDANRKPVVTLKTDDGSYPPIYTASIDLGELNGFAEKEYREAAGNYLGRTSNAATFAYVSYTDASHNEPYTKVLPNSEGTKLTMKVDFTLVSRDGYGETIEVTGATATVPAAYAQWKPNYAYTYLFKLSDNTNCQIGEVTGLYPITLDAVVATELDGTQETITTVNVPSITTYAKESKVIDDDEYKKDANIYVVIGDNTKLIVPNDVKANAKLYYVTLESGSVQEVTEKSVANALVSGTSNTRDKTWTVTDALGKKMVVYDTEEYLLTADTKIPAEDAPRGVDLTVNCAKFTPAAKYVVVPNGTALTAGVTYYTSDTGEGGAVAVADEISDGTKYRKVSEATGYYVFEFTDGSSNKHYKVIRID